MCIRDSIHTSGVLLNTFIQSIHTGCQLRNLFCEGCNAAVQLICTIVQALCTIVNLCNTIGVGLKTFGETISTAYESKSTGGKPVSYTHLDVYKRQHTAVDHLSFQIEKGKIYGFLGPNGAGKSTTMNMITGSVSYTHLKHVRELRSRADR